MATILGWQGAQKMMTALAATEAWDSGKIRLFKSSIVLTPGMAIEDFVEADFTGYTMATLPITTIAYGINAEGDVEVIFPHIIFHLTAMTVTNLIYGWWLESELGLAGDPYLITAVAFDTPFSMNSTINPLIVEPRVYLGQPQRL